MGTAHIGYRLTLRMAAAGRRGRHGFTLLELLIVIAMMSMLIAIILSSLRGARAQAKRTSCVANLRGIGSAWNMYLVDFDGRFLKGINSNWNYGGKQGNGGPAYGSFATNPAKPDVFSPAISKPLNPYLNYEEIVFDTAEALHCPADRGGADVPTVHYDYKGTSYATNLMLVGQSQLAVRGFDPCKAMIRQVNRYLPSLKLHQISRPASVIMIGDGGWLNAWDIGAIAEFAWHESKRKFNVTFLDGHVEFLRVRKGLHATAEYDVLPFRELIDDALACQVEVKDD